MWINKPIKKALSFTQVHLKELFFGSYLAIVLFVSVLASMQGGSGYGTLMYATLTVLFIFMVVPKIKKRIESFSCSNVEKHRTKGLLFFGLFFLLSFMCFLFWFIAYYPGAYSVDSINQYVQVQTGRYNDWHPVLQTLLSFTLPLKLTGAVASITFFQIVLFSLVLGTIAKTSYTYCGTKNTLILVLPIILSSWTLNISMFPWKDVTFALTSSMCMVFAANIFFQRESWSKPVWKIVLLSCLLLCATAFRHNGILFSLPFAITLFFFMPIKHWLFFITLFIVALSAVRGPIYTILNVQKPSNRVVETVGFPLSVITYVAKECPQCLNEESTFFVESLTKFDTNWKKTHSLEGFNTIKFDENQINLTVVENAGQLKIIKIMLQCFKNAPIYSAIAIGGLTSIIYGLEINCDNDPKIVENKYGIVYEGSVPMRNISLFYSAIIRKTPLRFILNTIGMPIIIMLALILFRSRLTKEDVKRAALCSPILVYDFGTMLFLSGAESRFFYANLLICPLIATIMLGKPIDNSPKSENKSLTKKMNH